MLHTFLWMLKLSDITTIKEINVEIESLVWIPLMTVSTIVENAVLISIFTNPRKVQSFTRLHVMFQKSRIKCLKADTIDLKQIFIVWHWKSNETQKYKVFSVRLGQGGHWGKVRSFSGFWMSRTDHGEVVRTDCGDWQKVSHLFVFIHHAVHMYCLGAHRTIFNGTVRLLTFDIPLIRPSLPKVCLHWIRVFQSVKQKQFLVHANMLHSPRLRNWFMQAVLRKIVSDTWPRLCLHKQLWFDIYVLWNNTTRILVQMIDGLNSTIIILGSCSLKYFSWILTQCHKSAWSLHGACS